MKGTGMDKCLVVTFNDTVLTNQPIGLSLTATDFLSCTIKKQWNAHFFKQKK